MSEWLMLIKKQKSSLKEVWVGGFTNQQRHSRLTPEHVSDEGKSLCTGTHTEQSCRGWLADTV